MKKFLFVFSLVALLCSPALSQTLLHLNFDNATPGGPFTDNTVYNAGASEIIVGASAGIGNATVEFVAVGGADGPQIGAAPGGLSGTAQGGNVLLLDGAGSNNEEGIAFLSTLPLLKQDFTLEAIWFTDDAAAASNVANIQSIIGTEHPGGEIGKFFVRTIGDDIIQYWSDRGDGQGEGIEINQSGLIQNNTWYHDVLVFDYNEMDPTTSTLLAYRDNILQGTSTYDANMAMLSLFPATAQGRAIAIGYSPFQDGRSLSGGIDAVAVSAGALSPGDFVLPGGDTAAFTEPYPGPSTPTVSGRYAMEFGIIGGFAGGADSALDKAGSNIDVTGRDGHKLLMSFYARKGSLASSLFFLGFAAFDDSDGWLFDTVIPGAFPTPRYVAPDNFFHKFEVTYTVPAGAVRVNPQIRTEYGGNGIIVDDYECYDITAGESVPVINGNFETWVNPAEDPTGWRFYMTNELIDTLVNRIEQPGVLTSVEDSVWENYR